MKKIILSLLILFLAICQAASLDEKISQMIIIGFDGSSINSKDFKNFLKKVDLVSGAILFDKNIDSIDELKKMIQIIKNKSKIVPFIAIDNEGGQVLRVKSDIKSAKEVAKLSNEDAHNEYQKLAKLNHDIGINLNFAPVADLEINKNSIISKKERSYSDDYRVVSEYASVFIKEHSKYGIITSLKHFPGHGSALGDTHLGFVDNTEVFNTDELMPYYLLKDNDKTTMVMVSHIFNGNIDKEYPASLSDKTINGLLKNYIGFRGVIISDDYDMGAIRDNYKLDEIIVRAVNSGVDILLFSNNLKYYDKNIAKKIHKIIKKEIKKGNINEETIDYAYNKILNLKKQLN